VVAAPQSDDSVTAEPGQAGARAHGGTEPALDSRLGAFMRAGLVFALVVGLDQLTKHTIAQGIRPGDHNRFLPGINFVHVRNTGVAFGFFSGGGAVVLALTIIALVLLVSYLALRPDRPWLWLPTGMLVGGAVGNLIDRIDSGSVIDFIKLPAWPAFNVADMSITFGVFVLLWVLERPRKNRDGE
jgi:signal peptidase II